MGALLLSVLLSKFLTFEKPSYATELYQKGMTHALASEYSQAEAYFTEALRLEPQESGLWTCRALARGMTGNLSGAASDWEESKRWDRDHIDKIIEDAYDADDWAKIIEYTEWFHHKKKLGAAGNFYHASALIGVGRTKEALPFIKAALEYEDELGRARGYSHYLYGHLLIDELKYVSNNHQETLQKAIEQLDKASESGFQSSTLLRLRAYASWELGKIDDAIRDIRKATILNSQSASLRLELIASLLRVERWNDAQEELVWMKRLTMTPTEQTQYAEYGKQVATHTAKQATTAPPSNDSWLKTPASQLSQASTQDKR